MLISEDCKVPLNQWEIVWYKVIVLIFSQSPEKFIIDQFSNLFKDQTSQHLGKMQRINSEVKFVEITT